MGRASRLVLVACVCLFVASLPCPEALGEGDRERWVASARSPSGDLDLVLTRIGSSGGPKGLRIDGLGKGGLYRTGLWYRAMDSEGIVFGGPTANYFDLCAAGAALVVVHLASRGLSGKLTLFRLERHGATWKKSKSISHELQIDLGQVLFSSMYTACLGPDMVRVSLGRPGRKGKPRHVLLSFADGSAVDVPERSGPPRVATFSKPAEPASVLVTRKEQAPALVRLLGRKGTGKETVIRWEERVLAKGVVRRTVYTAPWMDDAGAEPIGIGWDARLGWAYVVSRTKAKLRVHRRYLGARDSRRPPMSPDTESLVDAENDVFRFAFDAPAVLREARLRSVRMLEHWILLDFAGALILARPQGEGRYLRELAWCHVTNLR